MLTPKTAKALGRVGGLGLEIGVFILLGVKGGEWLDRRFDTSPVLQRVGLFLGLFAGFYSLWKLARVPFSPPPSAADDDAPGEGPDRP